MKKLIAVLLLFYSIANGQGITPATAPIDTTSLSNRINAKISTADSVRIAYLGKAQTFTAPQRMDSLRLRTMVIDSIKGNLYVTGDFKYNLIHAVGSADSVVSYTPTVTQNAYTKINTSSATNGMTWREKDGITCAGDSVTIITAGDYYLQMSITLSGTNANDFWRIKVYRNGSEFSPNLGRFRFRTTSNNVSDTRGYFWYASVSANDVLTWRITNESANRNPTITDMKIYIRKEAE